MEKIERNNCYDTNKNNCYDKINCYDKMILQIIRRKDYFRKRELEIPS